MKKREVVAQKVATIDTYVIVDPFGEPQPHWITDYNVVRHRLFDIDGVISVKMPYDREGIWEVEVEVDIDPDEMVDIIELLIAAVRDNRIVPHEVDEE